MPLVYTTVFITNVTMLALDNNRLRYTAVGNNPYQSIFYFMRFTCWMVKENINVQT